ncbi:ArsR family transcriptional regulator, partial [uncultured Phascolarctobacterium sp.]
MTHIHNHALPLPGKDDEKYIQPMADIFKVLSDPTRIRILSLLAHEEMCVTCIADAL